ncbi:MAG: AAA family ATPase [Candidatus Nanohaloarchaea archaeon]
MSKVSEFTDSLKNEQPIGEFFDQLPNELGSWTQVLRGTEVGTSEEMMRQYFENKETFDELFDLYVGNKSEVRERFDRDYVESQMPDNWSIPWESAVFVAGMRYLQDKFDLNINFNHVKLKFLLDAKRKGLAPKNVFLQHSGKEEHLDLSIRNPLEKESFKEELDEEDEEELESEFYAWGATPGTSNESYWDQMTPGDLVLFYLDKEYVYKGVVSYKTDNSGLAENIWGKDDEGDTWRYMFFFDDIEKIELSDSEVNRKLGYDSGYYPQGLVRSNTEDLQPVVSMVNNIDTSDYFILRTGSGGYEDKPEDSYHFKEGIPGSKQLREAENPKFVYQEDGKFYAKGIIKEIKSEERDGETHYFGQISNYEELDESVPLEEVQEKLSPNFPVQYGIIKITEDDYNEILGKNTMTSENSERVSKMHDLLKSQKNVLFYGPPGTGKTYLASQIAERYYSEGNNFETPSFEIPLDSFSTLEEIAEINQEHGVEGTGKGYTDEEAEEKAKKKIREIESNWKQLRQYLIDNISDLESYRNYIPNILRGTNQAKNYMWMGFHKGEEKYSKKPQLQVNIEEDDIRTSLWYTSKSEARTKLLEFLDEAKSEDLSFLDEIRLRTDEEEIKYSQNFDLSKIKEIVQDSSKVKADFSIVFDESKFDGDNLSPKKIAAAIEGKILPLFKFATGERNRIEISEKGRYELVTFHPSFSYEEFIEGIKPTKTDSGEVSYPIQEGVFKEICEKARSNSDQDYLLIIDEINRGNVASIFGELITLIESGKREEVETNLPYSKEPFTIPENLHILGTMNTADRSIALMDVALRRRFSHVEFNPDITSHVRAGSYESREEIERKASEGDLKALSLLAIESMNEELMSDRYDFESGKKIGHSYFFDSSGSEEVLQIWKYEIIPLLQEYFFDDYSEITRFLKDNENTIINDDMKSIRDFDQSELRDMLEEISRTGE